MPPSDPVTIYRPLGWCNWPLGSISTTLRTTALYNMLFKKCFLSEFFKKEAGFCFSRWSPFISFTKILSYSCGRLPFSHFHYWVRWFNISDGVSRPVFWSIGLGLEGLRSRLGLEGFRSRSRALSREILHRLFFMKFCKELLKKRFWKMIVQNSTVQSGQWLSFLCCDVICEMEKTTCPLPI